MTLAHRIICDVIFFLLIFVSPWWQSVVLVAAGIFVFRNFYEALLFGVLLDSFHGVTGATFFGLNSLFTIGFGLVIIISLLLKTRLRFYKEGGIL